MQTPKRVTITNQNSFFFVISSRATLNETLTAKNNDILPRAPYVRLKSEIYTPKQDDEHPRPFHMGVPPPPHGKQDFRRVSNYFKLLT